MKKLTAIVIGAGNRGIEYTDTMANMPDQFQVVAVAEPIESRRNYVKGKHQLPENRCFKEYHSLFSLGKIADFAIIATMDRDHFEPAIEAISLGYDLLLEEPISPNPEECEQIVALAEEKQVKVVVCTVLRYSPVFSSLKKLIDSGKIGKVMSVNHEECIGNIHQSHSYVRGNWGREEKSSNLLLQKSCHDMDILQWLLGKQCKKVQSFGALSYFIKENAPDGAPEYCIHGCPKEAVCPYNAVKLYLENKDNHWFRTTCTKEVNPTDAMVKQVISSTRYGRCVFQCDNNVIDHQTVNLLFEDDTTVAFNINAFNKGGRFIHIMGTKGEVHAALDGDSPIRVYDFETQSTHEIPVSGKDDVVAGHGGGDWGMITTLYQYLNNNYNGKSVPTIRESSTNHLIAFAAEESRKTDTVVDFAEYVKKFRK